MRLLRLPCLVMVAFVMAGCRLQGLQFREDHGFRVLRPSDRSRTTLPVVVRWTRPTDESRLRRFAVFVDRPPPRPGRGLEDLARQAGACIKGRPCPSQAYLHAEQIYVSEGTSVTITVLPRRIGAPFGLEDVHEATVVLLDGRSRRIGERVASVQFRIVRGPTSSDTSAGAGGGP